MLPALEYVTADLERKNVTIRMDITDIPYPDATFDAIVCVHVLEHIQQDRKALSELYRVLKPGGWAILQVPMNPLKSTFEDPTVTSPQERLRLFNQEDHVRVYGIDYFDRLAAAGFIASRDTCADRFSLRDIHMYGLSQNEYLHYCVKPVR